MQIKIVGTMNFRGLIKTPYTYEGKEGIAVKAKFEDQELNTHILKVRTGDVETFEKSLVKDLDYDVKADLRIYDKKASLYLLAFNVPKQ